VAVIRYDGTAQGRSRRCAAFPWRAPPALGTYVPSWSQPRV